MVAGFKKIKKGRVAKNIFFPIFLGLIFLAAIGFLIFSNLRINQRRVELQTKIEGLKKEFQALETRKAKLEAGIAQTEKESHWEEIVRQQGFVREGEKQVVVVSPESQEVEEKEEKSLWNSQGWWEKITKWFEGKLRD